MWTKKSYRSAIELIDNNWLRSTCLKTNDGLLKPQLANTVVQRISNKHSERQTRFLFVEQDESPTVLVSPKGRRHNTPKKKKKKKKKTNKIEYIYNRSIFDIADYVGIKIWRLICSNGSIRCYRWRVALKLVCVVVDSELWWIQIIAHSNKFRTNMLID